uniref:Amino acid permease/ SLC12A domain-containing protein n=1 Tax=Amphimedon queenslandica TaxID=400682 RepID=A0A1X7TBH0_AMPQE
HSHNLTSSFEDTNPCVGEIVLAFYSVLFSYEGWNGIGYTVEENKNVKRNLLLGIFLGVPCVTGCYVLVNIAYFAGLSKSQVLSSPATALTLAQSTIGDAGLVLIPLMVAVSTIGAATGAVYAGSRVMYTTARDGNLIETLSLLHNKFQTPVMALIVQGLLTCLLIVIGSIGHLIDGLTTLMWVFYGLVFVGLLVMRFTRRQETRPFKSSGPFLIYIYVLMLSGNHEYIPTYGNNHDKAQETKRQV